MPLINYAEKSSIRPVTKIEKWLSHHDISQFSFITINEIRRSYSLLTHSELSQAIYIKKFYVITHRHAETYFTSEFCTNNICAEAILIGNYIIHRIDDETFLLKLKDRVHASLECDGSKSEYELHTSIIRIPVSCELKSRIFYISPYKNSISAKQDTIFNSKLMHPMLTTFDKNFTHVPGYVALKAALSENSNQLSLLHQNTQNMTKTNQEIKTSMTNIHIIGAAAGGGLGLAVLLLMFCVCCCICANKDNLRLPF